MFNFKYYNNSIQASFIKHNIKKKLVRYYLKSSRTVKKYIFSFYFNVVFCENNFSSTKNELLKFITRLLCYFKPFFYSFSCSGWTDESLSPFVYTIIATRQNGATKEDSFVLYKGTSPTYEVINFLVHFTLFIKKHETSIHFLHTVLSLKYF